MAKTLTFCITHTDPLVPRRFFDHEIALGDYGTSLPTHVSRLDAFWHVARPVAYSAAGNYTLSKAVALLGETPDCIGVLSQRKIMSRELIGRSAPVYPTLREVSRAELAPFDVGLARPAENYNFLITNPLHFPDGVVAQYASAHVAVDLFDYLSLAVDLAILEPDDVRLFALQKVFIPGGCELGFYPADWLLPTLTRLEALGRAFLMRYDRRIRTYNSQQVRALSFLSERLGSFLLIKKLKQDFRDKIDNRIFGHMCVVIDQGTYSAGLAT